MPSLLGLDGKVAIVTGGGGNIGRETVRMLVEGGARVVAADLDGERVRETAEQVGAGAVAVEADATTEDGIRAMLAAAAGLGDTLDIAVNFVGGGGSDTPIVEMTDSWWESIIELNLYSTVRCSRAWATKMTADGTKGSIVNIASTAGLRAAPGMAAYGAAKAAVIAFTWTLAVELAPHGIRANVVVPAFVPNPRAPWGGTTEQQDALAKRTVPMGRVTKPEEVAGAVICFASDLVTFSTGQVLICDGGRMVTNPIFS